MISWPAANGMAASRAVPMQTDAPSGTTRAIASRSETSLEADTPFNSTDSAGVFKRVGAARAAPDAAPRRTRRDPALRGAVGGRRAGQGAIDRGIGAGPITRASFGLGRGRSGSGTPSRSG